MRKELLVTLCFSVLAIANAISKENAGQQPSTTKTYKVLAEDCDPATSQIDLDINNVRARILGGGDFWWDLNVAKYEVPKIPDGSDETPVSSLFAGSVWVGGIDENQQLKMAAQTYRQSGNDFWPGPLDENGVVDKATCDQFDQHWKVNGEDIDQFRADYEAGVITPESDPSSVPLSILKWPGSNNPYLDNITFPEDRKYAPFYDVSDDGIYDPLDGDYPTLDYSGSGTAEEGVYADQMIWWVYNDRGNIHTETNGISIGLEVQALAFAFKTNDERNDMTFYKYRLINKSTTVLNETYMGVWCDADLGYHLDDFVGCDTSRDLGICYNGDADDEGATGYGENPPLVGVDYFQGPTVVQTNSSGNDTTIQLGMSSFLYYDNDFTVTGNPTQATHYYGYLSGSWKDGSPFLFGGGGHASNGGDINRPFNFMFPSDPTNRSSDAWSECNTDGNGAKNPTADRRFLQSSGPFTLDPGAVNEIIIGVVWVRPVGIYPCPPFSALQNASDKAQVLFDSNFKIIDGPDAPDMTIRELDQELIIALSNDENSNNFRESYAEVDATITAGIELADNVVDPNLNPDDTAYVFQGYIVYQLKNSTVTSSDFGNPSLARVVAQVDVKDQITKLVNYEFDPEVGALVPTLKVTGKNEGITKTFRITNDAFAEGNSTLVNYKNYYFSVISYATNEYLPFDPARRDTLDNIITGQAVPFLAGRKNVQLYTAIPHAPLAEAYGTQLNAAYGDGPQIKRLDGSGNGGIALSFTPETESQIVEFAENEQPVYMGGAGPFKVFVYDPIKVPADDFVLYIKDTISDDLDDEDILSDSAYWILERKSDGKIFQFENTIGEGGEYIIDELGLVIEVEQQLNPGYKPGDSNNIPIGNGLIETELHDAFIVDNEFDSWLTGMADADINGATADVGFRNWIRSGTFIDGDGSPYNSSDYQISINVNGSNAIRFKDPNEVYEDLHGGQWAPYSLSSYHDNGLSFGQNVATYKLDILQSVDIVFTADKSKWSRCPVVETGDRPGLSEGEVANLDLRDHAGLNLDGTYSTNSADDGMGWFPGYAINLETGERLNIFYGESSFLVGDNGNDMIWNPTDRLFTSLGEVKIGGKHFIYVHNSKYDEGDDLHDDIKDGGTDKRQAYQSVMWTSPAMATYLNSFEDGLIPTETRVSLRVTKPYIKETITGENNGLPMYAFSTRDLAPEKNSGEVAETILDAMNIVPNPYYAFSQYENSQLENRVKITNLPPKCVVTIYTVDGALVRRFLKDDISNDEGLVNEENAGEARNPVALDWDLKNFAGVPISSGMYIIHVDANNIGERTIKFMCIMRPIDLDSF